MAHLEIRTTNGRVITHVKGRVFRFQNGNQPQRDTLARRSQDATKERRRVCLLTVQAAAQLEQWHISQPCFGRGCKHTHHTRASIEAMEKRGEVRWIGAGKNVATFARVKVWKPAKSEGMTVLQMVDAGA